MYFPVLNMLGPVPTWVKFIHTILIYSLVEPDPLPPFTRLAKGLAPRCYLIYLIARPFIPVVLYGMLVFFWVAN